MSAPHQSSAHSFNIKTPLPLSPKSTKTIPNEQSVKSHFITINSKIQKTGHVNLSLNRGISPDTKSYTESKGFPGLLQETKKLVAFRPRKRSVQGHSSSKFKLDVAEPISSLVFKGLKQVQAMILLIVKAMDTLFVIIETFFMNFMKEVFELEDSRNVAFMSWIFNKLFPEKANLGKKITQAKHQKVQNPPQKESKLLTLVLDLDETLIHSTTTKPKCGNFSTISVLKDNGVLQPVYIKKRPFLNHFLTKVSEHFNLVIFTASNINYANSAIDLIDENSIIPKRLYRQSCSRTENGWAKNLTKVERDLAKVILLDNCDVAGSLQPENHLMIDSWFYNEKDDCLLTYAEILINCANRWKTEGKEDIRKYIKQHHEELKAKKLKAMEIYAELIH